MNFVYNLFSMKEKVFQREFVFPESTERVFEIKA